jgi:hypothetical protein
MKGPEVALRPAFIRLVVCMLKSFARVSFLPGTQGFLRSERNGNCPHLSCEGNRQLFLMGRLLPVN